MYRSDQRFTRDELEQILNAIVGKTLGEVDRNNVFEKTIGKPKITGIAGDVIEQSVLGYPSDIKQHPDILVDDEEVEVKTTGIRRSKKNEGFEAKEPMSITAVSPHRIVSEEFYTSSFWHKLEKLLLIFYHYNSDTTVPSWDYANFPIKGYEFISPDEEERERLKNDWEIVRDFIREIQTEFIDNPESQYPRISSELRPHLMLIDTAPKYPNPPRFRLKRATVNKIVQEALGKEYEELPEEYNSFEDLDRKLRELTQEYGGMTVRDILERLEINYELGKNSGDVSKRIGEVIITRMFDANVRSMGNIELFAEAGIIGKTIVITEQNTRTEDTKFFTIDFTEIKDTEVEFENSQFYDYFSQSHFLFIIFEESNAAEKLLDNRFIGFKRLTFSEEFIQGEVKRTWDEIRDLVINDNLVETEVLDKHGQVIINPNGVVRTQLNFPKSKDNLVFVRGTGSDSSNKPFVLNGINMYYQQVWIKGKAMVERLHEIDFV